MLGGCTAKQETNVDPPKVSIPNSTEQQINGKVVGVSDGDTIKVFDGAREFKIRLSGIDAPESRQAFGQKSKQNLSNLIFGKTVTVTWNTIDRYGRVLGKVIFKDGDVCLQQIENGLAWHYKKYENEQAEDDRKLYAAAEVRARKARVGLWSDPSPTPPWTERAAKRSKTKSAVQSEADAY